MATVRPFKALRYTEKAGDLATLVAPPYDVISPDQRNDLAGQNEYNIVKVTLPEQEENDRSKYVKYARSAARIEEWRRNDVMQLEEAPSYYRYSQTFKVPGTEAEFTRTKLISTIKVEPYSNNVVLPHEQTFPKHKEDRMRILEATRSHVECIFGLFEDDDQSVHGLITGSPGDSIADITLEDGIRHVVERIDNPEACQAISDAIAPKKVWIADGHHRYETALAFREKLGPRDGLIAEDFMMMALCSISDPGLVLLPTHRILKRMPCTAEELRPRLSEHFKVSEQSNDQLMANIEAIEKNGGNAFGIALPGGNGLIAEFDNVDELAAKVDIDGSMNLKKLDVSILHGFIFSQLLGLTGHDFFSYTRIEQEATSAVEDGAPAAFLMNPPSVNDMRVIASGGDFMPQKSTYYYPKLLSGLALWSLKDFVL